MISGRLRSFSLVSGGDVIDTGEEEDRFFFLREAIKLKSKSCSLGNFSQKLVQLVFQAEELLNRNCIETRGKQALDKVKLGWLRVTFLNFILVRHHWKVRNMASASFALLSV